MKIGIDARFFGSIGKGLGRYTQKLIENLELIDQGNEYIIFLRKENFDEYIPRANNFKKVLADYRWYGISEQIFFPRLLRGYNLDVVHFPHFNVPIFYRRPIIVTIHDLILLHFPTLRGTTLSPLWFKIKFIAYKLTIKSALSRSRAILVVSEFTKKDILQHYNIDKEKIFITYEAANDYCYVSNKNDKEILKKYGIIKPYLLYVGNAYPHKNLEFLTSVFSELKKEKSHLNMVLVGKEDYFYSNLKEFVSRKGMRGVFFPGYVSDQDLDVIYRNSELYVFPSLYEGFGLPPLEAMSKGIPVISSDHDCMREILRDSALFFNAKDKNSLSCCIRKVLENDLLKKNLIEKGYNISKLYSWKKMAKETLEIYKNIN